MAFFKANKQTKENQNKTINKQRKTKPNNMAKVNLILCLLTFSVFEICAQNRCQGDATYEKKTFTENGKKNNSKKSWLPPLTAKKQLENLFLFILLSL